MLVLCKTNLEYFQPALLLRWLGGIKHSAVMAAQMFELAAWACALQCSRRQQASPRARRSGGGGVERPARHRPSLSRSRLCRPAVRGGAGPPGARLVLFHAETAGPAATMGRHWGVIDPVTWRADRSGQNNPAEPQRSSTAAATEEL